MAEAEFLKDLAKTLLKKLQSEPITKVSSVWGLKRQLLKLEGVVKAIQTELGKLQVEAEEHNQKAGLVKRLLGVLYEVDDLIDDIVLFAMQKPGDISILQEVRLFFSPSNHLAFVATVIQRVHIITKVLYELDTIDRRLTKSFSTEDQIEIVVPPPPPLVSRQFTQKKPFVSLEKSKSVQMELPHRNKISTAAIRFDSRGSEFLTTQQGHHKSRRSRSCGLRIPKSIRSKAHQLPKKCVLSNAGLEVEKERDYLVPEEVVGRDDDRMRVVNMLLDSNVVKNVSIIPIVGAAGLGKTTLAELVYNDEKVKTHFEIRMWIKLSTRREVIRKIIKSACGKKPDESLGLEQLESQLKKQIEGRIYLLVLDGAWNEDAAEWHYFSMLLSEGARGSKILVTTRSMVVAKTLATVPLYELQGLSEHSSWELFKIVALKPGDASKHLLNLYGERFIRKCRGNPLTIKIVGSLLYGKSIEKWWHILQEKDFESVDILERSYDELPVRMKRCFAYCSLFPEEYEIKKMDLINLWLAQDLVEPQNAHQSIEDASEEHFMVLCRYFFKGVRKDDLGDVISCKMLDTAHYMARSLAEAGSTMVYSADSEFDSSLKHISFNFHEDKSWKVPPSLLEVQKLRTLLWMKEPEFERKINRSTCNMLMSKFRSLRVLDLHAFSIEKLPDSIGKLKRLRYLDLSKNDALVKLPNSITKLQNLQTLKLNYCQKLEKLPKGIGNLIRLRCLEIDECDSITYMPLGLKKLTSLQVLTQFVVNKPFYKRKARGGLRVLRELNNLKGSLKIEICGKWVSVVQEAAEGILRNHNQLIDLRINWGLPILENVDARNYQAILEALQPHHNLRILCIEGYRGMSFPIWLTTEKLASSLPNIVVITIEGCKECQNLPPFCRLPSLKRLTLRYMDNVQYVESSGPSESASALFFPFLEELTLYSFHNLKAWWKVEDELKLEEQQSFHNLLKLKIWNCPKLTTMPQFPFVENLDLRKFNCKLLETHPSSSISSSSLSSPSPLQRLQIKECMGLYNFLQVKQGLQGLKSIQCLTIDWCDTLSSLSTGLQQLTSLEELEISNCKELDISAEHEDGMPWKSLKSLQYLTFRGIPKMATLPTGLQYVVTIKFLWISACDGLTSLPEWIRSLTALGHLRIEGCTALTRLPHGLADLRSLVKVEIMECPQLIERCREHTGEDWPKIKHARVLLHKSWRYDMLSRVEYSQWWSGGAKNLAQKVEDDDTSIPSKLTFREYQTHRSSSIHGQASSKPVVSSDTGQTSTSEQIASSKFKPDHLSTKVEAEGFQPFTGTFYKLQS